jgi:hypothetical protein
MQGNIEQPTSSAQRPSEHTTGESFDVRCFLSASPRRWSRRSPTEADGALAFENYFSAMTRMGI